MDDKEKMIDDIVAMLDNSKEVTRGCADCSVNPMACSVPTIELPGDEDFER